MTPPKPRSRPDKASLWQHLRLFRQDILSSQPARLYRAWMAEFRTPFFRSYLCNDPALVRRVLDERPEDFPKSDRVTEGLRPLLGRSVFVTNGEEWLHQRRIIDPAFEGGRLKGMMFEVMEYDLDARGRIVAERVAGEEFYPADDVILAIGQENAFPWIERDLGIEFDKWDVPKVDPVTFESTRPGVFFGGDAAFGPKNIIWSVEQGHQAAISIHLRCLDKPVAERPPRGMNLQSRKMGMHEWSYANDYSMTERKLVPHVSLKERFKKINIEVELGFTAEQAAEEVQRCLNCDVQTVFEAKLCIECDACIDICPVDCLTMTPAGPEEELRTRLKAPATNVTQALYVSAPLKFTQRVMVKDEDVCVHCGLCAERCPTAAWDMQKSWVKWPHAADQVV